MPIVPDLHITEMEGFSGFVLQVVVCSAGAVFIFSLMAPTKQNKKKNQITNDPKKFHIKTSNKQIRILHQLCLPRVAPASVSERTTPNNIKPGNPLTSLMYI